MIVFAVTPPPKSCTTAPVSTPSTTSSPPATKSPSQVPDVPSFRFPELPAAEKWKQPSATAALIPWATMPSWNAASSMK